ncbi:MAG: SMC-Scp complex subunit ScpB [Myxococcota bacterium]
MPDPRNETTSSDAHEASLEDLVAALGKPRPGRDDAFDDEDDDEISAEAPPGPDGPSKDEAPDPYAEYSDLDLATSLPIDPDDDLSKIEGEASPRLMSIVESLLFAASKAMTVKDIRRLLKEPTKRQIQLALKQLIVDTQHRGVVVGQVAGGFRLRTHPDNAQFVQKMLAGKPVRLSRSQLESLAVVAYRQPVTKAELDHVRGVDCGAVLRVLLERDLAKIVGRKEEAGRPHLYGTTVRFLEFFNLKGLRDLPDLQEFRELSEESEATLKHAMGNTLSDEQEAMGQERMDFEQGAQGQGTDASAAAESVDASSDGEGAESSDPAAAESEGAAAVDEARDAAPADENDTEPSEGASPDPPDVEASTTAASGAPKAPVEDAQVAADDDDETAPNVDASAQKEASGATADPDAAEESASDAESDSDAGTSPAANPDAAPSGGDANATQAPEGEPTFAGRPAGVDAEIPVDDGPEPTPATADDDASPAAAPTDATDSDASPEDDGDPT